MLRNDDEEEEEEEGPCRMKWELIPFRLIVEIIIDDLLMI